MEWRENGPIWATDWGLYDSKILDRSSNSWYTTTIPHKILKILKNDLVRYGYNFVPTLYISRGERDFNGITLSYDDLEQGLQKWKKSNRCRSDKWFNPHIEQTYDTDLPEGILFPYFCYFTLDLLESRYLVRSRLHPSFELKGFLWGSMGFYGVYGVLWEDSIG